MIDWESFWINIYAGSIYFVLGILFSIWLIPKYTVRLLQKRNKRFLRTKIAYAITSLCYFFNKMPPEYKVNDEYCVIHVKNMKYPERQDFVAFLKVNLFKPIAIEYLNKAILKSITENESIDRYELMQDELKRIQELRHSLEEITGLHSTTIQEEIINEISQLCLVIRMVEKNNKLNKTHEELTGEREGIHGLGDLSNVYRNSYDLLKNLTEQRDFSIKFKNTANISY